MCKANRGGEAALRYGCRRRPRTAPRWPSRRCLPLGRGETVLIVEGERDRLLRDEEKLAALGYEPVGFELAADALAACRSEPGRFDIILVSHGSQIQDGLDLARAFHEIAPLPAGTARCHVHHRCQCQCVGGSRNFRSAAVAAGSAELAAALARCLRTSGLLQS